LLLRIQRCMWRNYHVTCPLEVTTAKLNVGLFRIDLDLLTSSSPFAIIMVYHCQRVTNLRIGHALGPVQLLMTTHY